MACDGWKTVPQTSVSDMKRSVTDSGQTDEYDEQGVFSHLIAGGVELRAGSVLECHEVSSTKTL